MSPVDTAFSEPLVIFEYSLGHRQGLYSSGIVETMRRAWRWRTCRGPVVINYRSWSSLLNWRACVAVMPLWRGTKLIEELEKEQRGRCRD